MVSKLSNIVLISFCIFVSSEQLRRNPKLFIYDKEVPTGSFSEREQNPVLDCFDNPKGASARKNFFDMSNKKDFATPVAVRDSVAFFTTYFNYLPFSKTQNQAFVKASVDYFNLYQVFKYSSFQQFKNSLYGTV